MFESPCAREIEKDLTVISKQNQMDAYSFWFSISFWHDDSAYPKLYYHGRKYVCHTSDRSAQRVSEMSANINILWFNPKFNHSFK